MKALLIYPPNQLLNIETPRPDGSLGPLYLASSLESKGIETDILDASVGSLEDRLEETFYKTRMQENGLIRIGMDFDRIAEYVQKGKYDFVGISSNFTPQTKMAFETAKAIKERDKNIRIYAGGTNARVLKNRFLDTGYFDAVCLTDGELILPRAILGGVENIPGFAYLNKNKEIKINLPDANCFPKSLDELPMPAWEKLPFEKYSQISSPHGVDVTENGGKYAPIMTSRGCVWRCLYCHISTEKEDIGNLRTHSIDRVINEVDKLKSLGIERLFFEDDSLFAKKDRAKEIFEKIQSKDISISNVNGVNLIDFYIKDKGGWKVDYKFINTLKKAGFKQMVFPAESGNQRILDKYASGKVRLDKMDLPKLMDALTKEGILSPANMIIGFPDETEKEIKNSLELAKRLRDSGAPYVTFFIPIPFPGSRLYDLAIREGYLKEDFNPDIMNWKNPVMQNTIISQERIVEIRDRANEDINDEEHLKKRLMQSAGFRWRG